jgi:hypothetical protein
MTIFFFVDRGDEKRDSSAIVPTRNRRSIRLALSLCAYRRPSPACLPWNTALTSSPACRRRMACPPGCAKPPKSITSPSTTNTEAPAAARAATSARVKEVDAP